jgi:adhesin/invasin
LWGCQGAGTPGGRQFSSRVFTITTGQATPQINTGGIVIHAGTSAAVSRGSIVDIYGTNLAATALNATAGQALPTTLGGVQVLVNGTAAPLIYVGPLQIIFQIPYETALGTASVVVDNDNAASAAAPVTVQQAAPFILTYGSNRAVVVNQDGSVNASGKGDRPGDVLVAYLIGSGPLDNPIATGADAPLSPLSREKLTTTVTVGGTNANVQFAGMTPGFAGLMQINFVMPNLAPGDFPIQVTIGGATSNQPLLTVSK